MDISCVTIDLSLPNRVRDRLFLVEMNGIVCKEFFQNSGNLSCILRAHVVRALVEESKQKDLHQQGRDAGLFKAYLMY